MKPPVWRLATLAYGAFLLVLAAMFVYSVLFANADPGFTAKPKPGTSDLRTLIVKSITHREAISGPLDVGDAVTLVDQSFLNRVRFARERRGDQFEFVRTARDGRSTRFVDTMVPLGPASQSYWTYVAMAVVFVLAGMVIGGRSPHDDLARLLVGLFFALGTILLTAPQPVMPAPLLVAILVLHLAAQPFAAYAALALAVTFPQPSARGIRRILARANLWLLLACDAILLAGYGTVLVFQHAPSPELQVAGISLTLVYYIAISLAFVVAGRASTGADRKRLQWVAWSLAAGFSGQLVLLVLIAMHVPINTAVELLNLTLFAIPFGLGYAILRHRVVDIGFVINRAIVFGTVSAIVVIAFGALEWALSNVFVRVSHITSTSLELALALVLGFSLRTIHSKVDRFVDDLFFRERHAADRALRTFAREVAYITDPRIALDRSHAELSARTGADSVAIYLVDARSALRVDPGTTPAPDAVGIDDAALVRMRADRVPVPLRGLDTALAGDYAFPMLVRDTLTGALVLGPKVNGEAYAPDELATIEAVATSLGNALDALQTAALKAEIASVLVDGTSLDALRRTIDATSWVRGVAQPAGSLAGLGE